MSKESFPTEVNKENAFTYATYTIIYLNDMAANSAFDVCRKLKNAQYNGNGAKIICKGLYNRAKEYFNTFNTIFKPTLSTIADFNCVYDDFSDESLCKFTRLIIETLRDNNIKNAEFIGYVETCRCVSQFACEINDYLVKKLLPICRDVLAIKNWRVTKIYDVSVALSDFVYSACDANNINLNDNEECVNAWKQWQENVLVYKNFKEALKSTYSDTSSDIN